MRRSDPDRMEWGTKRFVKREKQKKLEHERQSVEQRKLKKKDRKRRKACRKRRIRDVKKKYGSKAERTCTSKKYYDTKHLAMRAVRHMESLFHKRYDAYKCKYCGGWHLTTHGYGGENEAIRDPREIEIIGY